jgi:O-antigen/teichoic acid export membrane protein
MLMTVVTTSSEIGSQIPGARSNTNSRILSGAASLSASQIVRRACRTIFLLVAARKLGPANFGLYVLLLTVTELVATVSGGGYGDYLTREVAKFSATARRLLLQIIQLHFFYRFVLAALAIGALALFKFSPSNLWNAALILFSLFPRGVIESSQGIMRALHRFWPILLLELLQGTVLLCIGGFFLFKGLGVRGVIWAEVASVLCGAAVALPIGMGLAPSRDGVPYKWKELIRETLAFNVYPVITSTYDRIDIILLARLVGNTSVGIYSMPYRAYAALSVVPYGLTASLLPLLAKSNWEEEEGQRCRIMMQQLFAAALFMVLAILLLADVGVRLTLGPSFAASALTLKVLVWATVPMFLNYALNMLLLAKNKERVFLRTASVCTIVNIAANLMFIPHYGYLAAAAVTVLTELVLLAQNILLVWKVLGFVPLPAKAFGNSLVFFALFAGGYKAAQFLPSSFVAFVGLIIFAIYLFLSGSIPWRIQQSVTAPAP